MSSIALKAEGLIYGNCPEGEGGAEVWRKRGALRVGSPCELSADLPD
jgi:hypothetical protein